MSTRVTPTARPPRPTLSEAPRGTAAAEVGTPGQSHPPGWTADLMEQAPPRAPLFGDAVRPTGLTAPNLSTVRPFQLPPPPDPVFTPFNEIVPTVPPPPALAALPFGDQAVATWTALLPLVEAGKLPAGDAELLAEASGKLGIIGKAQAVRGARRAAELPEAEARTFTRLLRGASSDMARAFLYEALAAGHSIRTVQRFAKDIQGWSDQKLATTLNLADPLGSFDGRQDGVMQQFADSCVPTTAQALRGEMDPVYALRVRRGNVSIHAADNGAPLAVNPRLAYEQRRWLEKVGSGEATPRDVPGRGVDTDGLSKIFAKISRYTGFEMKAGTLTPEQFKDPAFMNLLLDHITVQLNEGIPTPIGLTNDTWSGGHAVLVVAAVGAGPEQQFLIHDPLSGNTMAIPRSDIVAGTLNIAGWNRLGMVAEAVQ